MGSANFSGVTRYFIVITHVFVVQMPFGMIRHGPTPDLLADPDHAVFDVACPELKKADLLGFFRES